MENAAGIRFILKYGFIIILILIAVFLMNRFGFFNVFLAPENCDISTGFDCISFSAHKDGINLILQNLHDYSVSVSEIRFRDCIFQGRTDMPPGITRPFLLKNCLITGKIKDNLIMEYFTPDNVINEVNGTLVVRVK